MDRTPGVGGFRSELPAWRRCSVLATRVDSLMDHRAQDRRWTPAWPASVLAAAGIDWRGPHRHDCPCTCSLLWRAILRATRFDVHLPAACRDGRTLLARRLCPNRRQ